MELMAVDVTARGDTLDVGVPRLLSAQPATVPGHVRTQFPWAVTADGQRFLVQRRPESSTAASNLRAIEVVLNWAQGIGK